MPAKVNFAKLQKLWYKKLKDEGFADIEHASGALDRPLTKHRREPIEIEVIQYYYYMASTFLVEYKFENEIDKIVWTYHCEGLSVRNISGLLAKIGVVKKKDSVWYIVKRLEKLMKDKYLAP